ncbi:MAG: cytidylate kinase family protein [Tannerella sp.]|jgi:uncharacterized membrane protein YczE/cytidylate kinase|nr:cytidylate kinase family protein [Tannerella sp.]
MNQTKTNGSLLRRYIVFIVSLFIVSLGVTLTLRSDMGSSPISVIPFVWSQAPGVKVNLLNLSFIVPAWTIGQCTFCMNILLVFIQMILLRKKFPKMQLLQIVAGTLFSFFIDLSMLLTVFFQWGTTPAGYVMRFIQMLAGGTILAYGITCEVKCNVLVLPAEGLSIALARVFRIDFSKAKICVDTSFVLLGVMFCFLFFGSWQWNMVGVGTLVLMIFVGIMVRFFTLKTVWLDSYLFPYNKEEAIAGTDAGIPASLVITIAREFGSGGHETGKILAEKLGMEFYDHKLIDCAAKELGINPEVVSRNEQMLSTAGLLELILMDKQIPAEMNPSEGEAIFIAQSRIIRQVSKEKSCVIIGRCADYILKDRPNCFNVFILSDMEFARRRVMDEFKLTYEEAEQKIRQTNQGRANHYWQYTGRKWNDAAHYDLVINTSRIGIEEAVRLIAEAVKGR